MNVRVVRKVDNSEVYKDSISGSQLISISTNSSLESLKDNDKLGWDIYGEVYMYEIFISANSG